MTSPAFTPGDSGVIQPSSLQSLMDSLTGDGYTLLGPTVSERVIVYDKIQRLEDLPVGWTDDQQAATYSLQKRKDGAYFGYVHGAQSWKKFVYPPRQVIWQAKKHGSKVTFEPPAVETPKLAFIGVRSCELQALKRLDAVFSDGKFVDRGYQRRRADNFIIAINCTEPGGTCFCQSMGTGPKVNSAFDLSLTEVIEKKDHYFVVTVGSERGAALLQKVEATKPTDVQLAAADKLIEKAEKRMGRNLDTNGLKESLQSKLEDPRWNDVAHRCLMCGNCTLVCPTCFCATIEDSTDLSGAQAQRIRRWDSCFTMDFSYVHGGSVRTEPYARYRQWLTHKLANWHDQFDMSGCVGCGRCITWCPVGIDITEEAKVITRGETAKSKAVSAKE